ncbi:hypothetical protein COCOBI_06-6320 [Coccomyxa sp. Obi]|nr:hypothetical protein COCOBI_06-6320 [Coccomyxa sp. Obi]
MQFPIRFSHDSTCCFSSTKKGSSSSRLALVTGFVNIFKSEIPGESFLEALKINSREFRNHHQIEKPGLGR